MIDVGCQTIDRADGSIVGCHGPSGGVVPEMACVPETIPSYQFCFVIYSVVSSYSSASWVLGSCSAGWLAGWLGLRFWTDGRVMKGSGLIFLSVKIILANRARTI